MSMLLVDLRHALRRLAAAPVFTGVTVLTLALGIGANSAMFSLVNAALLRPLGFEDPDSLMFIHEGIPSANLPKLPGSAPDIIDLRRYQRSFSRVAAFSATTMELSGLGEPQRVTAARMEHGMFPLLGVRPLLGRTFTPEEDAPGRDVAVLSYAMWQRFFQGRPDAVGATVRLDRRPYRVIGVMPASFEFPKRGPQFNGTPADVWIPMGWTSMQKQARGSMFNNSVLARLKPGVSVDQASAELRTLGPRIYESYPAVLRAARFELTLSGAPLREEISGQVRMPLLVLFAAVGFVLLIACANVANLILSRAATRRRELNVRLALGASGRRIFQLLLCESLLLAITGGLLGLAAARLLLDAVPAVLSTSLPGLQEVALDARVLGFTAGLSVLTALVFGLAPAFTSDRGMPAGIRDGGRGTGAGGWRIQQALVTVTVGLAVVLLVGAGLLVRSFAALMSVDPGFRAHQVLTLTVALPTAAYPSGRDVGTFVAALHERISAMPGARRASISTDVPLESNERRAMTPQTEGDAGPMPSVALTWSYGDYFGTFGVPIARGRAFTAVEEADRRPVAIVSESLAAKYWPGEDAVGKRIKNGPASSPSPWLEIVGVAGNVFDGPLTGEPTMHVYLPISHLLPDLDFLARTGSSFGRTLRVAVLAAGDPSALVASARAEVARLDSALPVTKIATMEQQVAESTAPQSFSTTVLTGFAAGALLLAAIGLYGVLAFAVAQRTREIGVRMALGATPGSVIAMVLRQGMVLVAAGLLIGLSGAIGVTRVMTSLLYRTQPLDAWTFAAVPVVLASAALAACYLPARRAASVEPTIALRTE